jgi:hypothetical protein
VGAVYLLLIYHDKLQRLVGKFSTAQYREYEFGKKTTSRLVHHQVVIRESVFVPFDCGWLALEFPGPGSHRGPICARWGMVITLYLYLLLKNGSAKRQGAVTASPYTFYDYSANFERPV